MDQIEQLLCSFILNSVTGARMAVTVVFFIFVFLGVERRAAMQERRECNGYGLMATLVLKNCCICMDK